MKHTNDLLMWAIRTSATILTIGVLLQRPIDWQLVLAAGGFSLFIVAWTGMYFRLKRDVPDHALIEATYLRRFGGLRGRSFEAPCNMFRLMRFHFERRRMDLSSILLITGLAMLAASLIGHAR